jgi:hypothetical protein
MNTFLWGNGFWSIVDSFGRPSVQHWTGLAFERGPAGAALPRTSSRRSEPIPPGQDPAIRIEEALEELRQRAATDGVHRACHRSP